MTLSSQTLSSLTLWQRILYILGAYVVVRSNTVSEDPPPVVSDSIDQRAIIRDLNNWVNAFDAKLKSTHPDLSVSLHISDKSNLLATEPKSSQPKTAKSKAGRKPKQGSNNSKDGSTNNAKPKRGPGRPRKSEGASGKNGDTPSKDASTNGRNTKA